MTESKGGEREMEEAKSADEEECGRRGGNRLRCSPSTLDEEAMVVKDIV
jgi:hypothetical protein